MALPAGTERLGAKQHPPFSHKQPAKVQLLGYHLQALCSLASHLTLSGWYRGWGIKALEALKHKMFASSTQVTSLLFAQDTHGPCLSSSNHLLSPFGFCFLQPLC